ncbi:choice-of-anchor A family protein [Kitasatospora purpeofusca]|uniref:choice-of-anchor A family protein n=1 Tax=Kitasatospora purpeofusca TaxID=67352 RepID=UPI00224E7523|nr:choice-of-anchor A family protein [Kitasatospora purpeofusca]MCX4752599.1 choice-of-anchor A family protein [Kitasatospora purpeofusca]WSR32167.1 choice-of-anchor A family protein [Kitasatospora purpeofusca]
MGQGQGTGVPGRSRTTVERPPSPRRRTAVRAAVATAVAMLPLAAVLTVGSAAPLTPPLGPCSGPDCPAVWPSPPNNGDFAGRDASITVFTGGNYLVAGRAAEAEGRIVTLGNFEINKSEGGGAFNAGVVGVGSRVVPPNGSDFLTVGGNVTVQPGNSLLIGGSDSKGEAFGNLRYAGTLTGTVSIDPTGQAIKDPDAAAPYQSVLTQIEEVSACVAKAAATGTVVVTSSEATFTGDGTSAKQVFNVPGNLAAPNGGQIGLVFDNIPAGATVVVNMLSDSPIINTYTGTGLAGDPTTELRSRLMWNFPTSTAAQILGSAQFQGSVMAGNPAGTTTISMPGMNGRVYLAGNLVQTGNGGYEIHSYPFDGDLPDCEVTPSPSPTSPSPSPTSPTPTPTPTETTTSPAPTSPSPTSTSPAPTSPTPTPTPTTSSATPTTSPSSTSAAPTSHGPSSHGPTGHHPAPSHGGGGGQLPSTGAGNAPVVLGLAGVGLLGLGALAVLAARRRGRHS